MNDVPAQRLDALLSLYQPRMRCVQSVAIEYPHLQGVCRVDPQAYTQEPLEHVATPAAQWCMYQLSFAAFAQWIEEGRFPSITLTFEQYRARMGENMLLLKSETKLRFRTPIPTGEEFAVAGRLEQYQQRRGTHFVKMNFNLARGRGVGEHTFALKL